MTLFNNVVFQSCLSGHFKTHRRPPFRLNTETTLSVYRFLLLGITKPRAKTLLHFRRPPRELLILSLLPIIINSPRSLPTPPPCYRSSINQFHILMAV